MWTRTCATAQSTTTGMISIRLSRYRPSRPEGDHRQDHGQHEAGQIASETAVIGMDRTMMMLVARIVYMVIRSSP